jgi:hypothetical protein
MDSEGAQLSRAEIRKALDSNRPGGGSGDLPGSTTGNILGLPAGEVQVVSQPKPVEALFSEQKESGAEPVKVEEKFKREDVTYPSGRLNGESLFEQEERMNAKTQGKWLRRRGEVVEETPEQALDRAMQEIRDEQRKKRKRPLPEEEGKGGEEEKE